MRAAELLDGVAAVLTPTTTWHPTIAQVQAEPVVANSRMGRFTNFANLMDMAAVAFPAGRVAGLPFGAMLTGPAFADDALAGIAAAIAAELGEGPRVEPAVAAERCLIDVFVVGAHRAGQVLNHELTDRGGEKVETVRTASSYRLYALDTVPPKPGLVRVADGGESIVGEVWRLPVEGFGAFVAGVPAPMAIGTVELEDGRELSGFVCEPIALHGAQDISDTGDWIVWLAGR
ncbi:allophanate hydrolase-related protein [Demequina salsinemoris]|uniref:allophanate hydrolase-related protein n=1 Tax=Demequina salsinemoris TaxID=577470 RepID=UPI001F47F0C6|nr:hypothetical protein [Demequina salsinemoris]